ncbi:Mitochondrial-processing peptidase subunit alpha [Taphrina deformans PYCC 5710]|uniref:Mitochondrial-processing peptidase subunit alpha n=1 Tax=Taphrina deformans (strain PYCC 5710 / ATCC 11124 / CBS 356.35 / IMI 108563 / JCM 9778 / NBRC 8474) TaxID=1097556 RepID=R4X7J8_TAPDE|nr:Mitochondrial-processing peptidase subunit alpha [Taphrina deformans PYCC 5710]|eukprot:CCG81088.1 Mitochondrial-processing peptidase subunit alpha [Taphrina deformans PYCC 5710]
MIGTLVRRRAVGLQGHRHVRRLNTSSPSKPIALPSEGLAGDIGRPPVDQVTTLPNGIRVATESTPGHFSAVGVFVECGSRFEGRDDFRGVSHIVDRLAFKSTGSRTQDEMIAALESLGGTQLCSSSRESLMYTASVFNQDVEAITELMADTVLNPNITAEEVTAQLSTAAYEIDEIWQKPEMILPELLHSAAYRDNTLGHPLLCPEERLGYIDAAAVRRYRDTFFRPDRIVLGFVGVPHAQAIHLSEKFFGHMTTPKSSSSSSSTSLFGLLGSGGGSESRADEVSRYTGGQLILPGTALPNEEWTHLHVAYEAPSLTSPEIYALATLQILLGGGGSFSAGGPGKGMYSRLYTNVLNRYGWIESCSAFNHTYADSGLFGIAASARPDASYALAAVVARELALLYDTGRKGIGSDEAERAKNQLRSSLLMNLESRMITLEDMGRQVQSLDTRVSAEEMCHHIATLSVADLRATAERILTGRGGSGSGTPTVLGAGPGVDKLGDVFAALERFGLGRR